MGHPIWSFCSTLYGMVQTHGHRIQTRLWISIMTTGQTNQFGTDQNILFQPPSSILCHGLIRKGTGTPCPYRQKHKYSHISQPISSSQIRGPLVPLQCQPSALCLKLWLWPLPLLIQGCQLARAILLYMSTGA